jgi:hypothetical protein
MALANRNILRTPSALRSGALTGLAQIVLAFAAAGAGALLAQKFGRTAETDGFLAAYGVYVMLVLAAQAFRMVVVPDLTRAAAEGRLARAAPTQSPSSRWPFRCPCSSRSSRPLGDLITGNLPPSSAPSPPRARHLVPAAFGQLWRRSLRVRSLINSYGTAAAGFALGGMPGSSCSLRSRTGPIVALAWGLAVNAAVAFTIPVVALILSTRSLVRAAARGRAAASGVSSGASVHLRSRVLPARAALCREARGREPDELLVCVPCRVDARRRDRILARSDLVRAAHAAASIPGGRPPCRYAGG